MHIIVTKIKHYPWDFIDLCIWPQNLSSHGNLRSATTTQIVKQV